MSCQAKEIMIPVPYGFIAVKAWGSDRGLPVLALHGYLDNAGSFDNLIPLLSPSLYVVAMDLPGHGLSSHKPRGTFYRIMDAVVDIELVVQYFKWEQFSIIGHSGGGIIATMYGTVFPERVSKIALLDVIKPPSFCTEALPEITRHAVGKLLRFERKMDDPTPVYSLEVANAKTRQMRGGSNEITESSAQVLLRRGAKPSPCGRGLVFTTDVRLRAAALLEMLSHDDLKAYMRRLKCSLLIILVKDHTPLEVGLSEVVDEFLNIYGEVCKSFKIVEVEGNHFVHLNQANRVALHINSFFISGLHDASKL